MFNGEHVTFITKDKYAQNFVIRTINEKLKLPGIIARGPRVGTKPNFHVKFPAVLDRFQPEIVIEKALSMHLNIEDISIQVRGIKKNEQTGGRTIACELTADILDKVQCWALENKTSNFPLFTEWLTFWTTPRKSTRNLAGEPLAAALHESHCIKNK